MSQTIATHLSKEIQPYYEKCKEKCGSEKPSDVIRWALKNGAEKKSPDLIQDAMKIDSMSDSEIIKELKKITKQVDIEKNAGVLGGDLWQEFLKRASIKKVDPAAFVVEMKSVLRCVLLQAAHSGIGAKEFLIHEQKDHYRAGQTKNERLQVVDIKRGANFRGEKLRNVVSYDDKGRKVLLTREEFERM